MAVVEEILRSEADGSISFGNHKLAKKAKVEDYEHAGDLLKVKTYNEMTKLEKNGMFLYESVPGTSVLEFKEADLNRSSRQSTEASPVSPRYWHRNCATRQASTGNALPRH